MEFDKAYNRETFLQFLRVDFLPDDFKPTDDFSQKQADISLKTKTTYISTAVKLGVCKSLDLVVYEIKHKGKNDPRVGLSKEAFRLLTDEWQDKALIIFVPENNNANYRFSLITIELDENEKGNTIRKYSNPRRYSYLLGEGVGIRTPTDYLLCKKIKVKDEKDLLSRFSVEVLTKAFYNELSDWYAWAVKIVKFPNKIDDKTDDDKYNTEGIIRLITRLIFVWFLKQKHLIPNEFFDEKYVLENFIDGFNPHEIVDLFGNKSDDSKYYKSILQNLFFAMLNSPITPEGKDTISERRFRNGRPDFDNNKLMRYKDMFKKPNLFVEIANKYVPFLNGGLFDCLDDKANENYIDGFSDRKIVKRALIVPDYLFFGEEVGKDIDLSEFYGDKNKKKESARGIIDILKRYNFTIEENTPFDQEISLDPELLGKVFENLLASFNPETETTARKQTGSFYTPREIVQYMVDESLIAHLKHIVGDELEDEYRKLMKYTGDEFNLTFEQKKAIMKALYDCKILDPACGSGAFPMGILQQMVHILSQLDPENELWKEMLMQNAIDETTDAYHTASREERKEIVADIEQSFDEDVNRPDYARKLYLIEKSIFGVDIQSIAVQISKLRFFISLVVDQKANENPAENFGIRPLPNLEAKFIAANTLIGLNKKDVSLFDTQAIKDMEAELKLAKHKIFGAKTYKTKSKYKNRVAELRFEIATLLKDSDALGNDEARQLQEWDMFDQNASSPFFDAEWMFGVEDGFDIVIGNPPYLRIQGLRDSKPMMADELSTRYKSATGAFDLYALFTERALNLINDNGIVNYIMPLKWTNAAFGKGLRGVVSNNNAAFKIINFGAYQVFNASTYTALQWFKKGTKDLTYFELNDNLQTNQELGEYLFNLDNKSATKLDNLNLNTNTWVLTDGKTTEILNKLNSQSRRINDIFKRIFCGLQTSKDDVYFLYNCKNEGDYIVGYSKHLDREITIEKGLVKPLLKGEDVHKYDDIKTNRVVIFPYKLQDDKATLFTEAELENLYPKGYVYLKECEDALRGRENGRLTNDAYWYKYIYPKNLVLFNTEKLVAPDISLGGNFAYDVNGEFYQTTTIYGYLKKDEVKESYKLLMAFLNSRLCWWFLINTGTTLANGYFRFKPDYINPFPVPAKIPEDISNKMEILVDYLLFLHNKKSPQVISHTSNKRIIVHIEDIMNMVIYELYFEDHMKEQKIDIAQYLSPKPLKESMNDDEKAEIIGGFYLWYQSAENIIRQRIMLVETRSPDLIYKINKETLYDDKNKIYQN